MAFSPKQPFNDLPPLPPKTEIESKEVLKKAVSATRSLAELKGATSDIPNPTILINSLTLKEAKSSSEIENIFTTNDELYKAFTVSSSNIDPQTKEVLNYREALWSGYNKLKKTQLLTTNLFIEVVQKIRQNTAGIRTTPGTVIKNVSNDEVIYTPPEGESLLRTKLKELEEYINLPADDADPLIKMSLIHYQFESIHPFYDGNGRTGRIIIILYLVHQNLLSLPILYLSEYIIDKKSDYYKLLQKVTRKGEWTEWILFMLDAIEVTSKATKSRIEKIHNLMSETFILAKENLPSRIYSKELIELLFEQPYCKVSFLVNRGIAKRQTAAEYLKELEKIGILSSKKVGKEVLYLNLSFYKLLSE